MEYEWLLQLDSDFRVLRPVALPSLVSRLANQSYDTPPVINLDRRAYGNAVRLLGFGDCREFGLDQPRVAV